jgi:hypothetical protein
MNAVELFPAFTWTCPACRSANLCYPVVAEMSAAERGELAAYAERDDFRVIPPTVNCIGCGKEFEAMNARLA